jgi:hypothetical protein
MGRDLLYKPPTPLVLPDEQKPEIKPGAQPADKLGVKMPSREIGRVEDPLLRNLLKRALEKAPTEGGLPSAAASLPVVKTPAFRSAYFNKDVDAARAVNLSSSKMQALRGAQGVTDLKKVVLPPSFMVSTPNPRQLNEAINTMGLLEDFGPRFENLLGKQGQWSQDERVTYEMLLGRLQHLEEMVANRVAALRRMQAQNIPEFKSTSINVAAHSQGNNVDESVDLAEAGSALVKNISEQAQAMHVHISKALGIKKK